MWAQRMSTLDFKNWTQFVYDLVSGNSALWINTATHTRTVFIYGHWMHDNSFKNKMHGLQLECFHSRYQNSSEQFNCNFAIFHFRLQFMPFILTESTYSHKQRSIHELWIEKRNLRRHRHVRIKKNKSICISQIGRASSSTVSLKMSFESVYFSNFSVILVRLTQSVELKIIQLIPVGGICSSTIADTDKKESNVFRLPKNKSHHANMV